MTEADRLGLSLSEYTLRLLRVRRLTGDLPEPAPTWSRTGDENLIGTRPEIADSSAHARHLREQAQRRHGA